MKKIIFGSVVLFLLSVFVFFNLGKWLDITTQPVKADLIVCLGGGTPERVKKSIALYTEGYSKQKLLLLPGEPYANKKYIKKHNPEIRFVLNPNAKSTADEVRFVKKYMADHGYDSVIIVSDPPQTRRTKILTDLISVKNDEKFSYVFVCSDVSWWDQDKYWKNPKALHFTLNETLKVPYTYLYYGLMEKLGIKWNESEYLALKKRFGEFTNRIMYIIKED